MKIILLILTYTLASLYAYAGTFQITSTDVDLDTNGAIQRNLGINSGFESDRGIAVEYKFDNGWSLQYATVDSNASLSHTLTAEDAVFANSILGANITAGGDTVSLSEDYESSVLMLKYNIGADLSERFFYNASFGVGFTKVEFDLTGTFNGDSALLEDSDRTFTYSIGYGLGYRLTKNASLIANYEYRDARDGEFETLGLVDANFDHTSLDIGVQMNF